MQGNMQRNSEPWKKLGDMGKKEFGKINMENNVGEEIMNFRI